MRGVAVLILAALADPGAARAQTMLDGPLAASETPAPAVSSKARPAKSVKVHPKVAHHAKAPSPDRSKAETPERDIPVARRTTEDNPLSLGMKWNGSNDNASQTRVQNYGGEASGTGAAVGLKLHF